jgi:hypothetical protein
MAADDQGDSRILWPDVWRLAFGRDHRRPLANVGWVLEGRHMYGYVEGYAWGARALYAEALRSHRSPEVVVFPLAFLWRHHLELTMKWIIALGRRAEGKPWGFPQGHDLVKLWMECLPAIEPMGPPKDPVLSNVEATLVEFQRIDSGADGFRYPVDRAGSSKSMPNVPAQISLPQLQEAMEALSTFFECVRSQLEHEADLASEEAAFYFGPVQDDDDMPF